jgi:Tfp pilus assembly protein PilN
MRAVNLIPEDQRRGAGGTGGRSGGVAFAVVGLLAGIVALVAVYAMTSGTISTRKSELQSLQQQVTDSQTANDQVAKYSALAAQRQARVATVTQIAGSRFDWAHAMLEIPRVLPHNVWLETLSGTVTPSSSGTVSSTAPAGPQIEIDGCTTGMIPVANVMVALSRMDGVTDVDLVKAAKGDSVSEDGCQVKTSIPDFDIIITYQTPGGPLQTSTDFPTKAVVDAASNVSGSPTVTPTPATPVSTGAPAGGTP